MAQPSLSQSLAVLEQGLGVQLIERSTRRVLVTADGEMLLPLAERVVDGVEEFVSAALGSKGDLVGTLRLGIIPTCAPYLVASLLPRLAEAFPGLETHIVEDQTARLLDSLRTGSLDAAIVALPTEVPGVTELPVYEEDFVMVVPSGDDLAGRGDLPVSVLDGAPLLLLDEGHCLREQVLDHCRRAGAPATGGDLRASSLATVTQCVGAGFGVTLVPATAVESEARARGLGVAHFAPPVPGRRMGLAYRSSSSRGRHFARLAGVIARAAEGTGSARPLM